jgi:hypothetical protein
MSIGALDLQRWRTGFRTVEWSERLTEVLPLVPIAVSMLVMAVALLPEVSVAIPNLNDDAAHYSLILNASRAIDAGQNPLDHWAPDLEFGYPQFAYYQHLPHLFVVGLNRLLFRQVDLLTLFNLTRYALMVGFPVTVYWSLRQLEFSRPAAAAAATFSPLLSAGHRFGIEYDSYVWRGYGMYTQLWAMHLSFLALACVYRTTRDGRGYLASALVLTALVLSHVIYAFIVAITLPMLVVPGMTRANAHRRVLRLLLAGIPAVIATAYFTVPLIINGAYHATSPYMEQWKYDSFGASKIMGWLVTGEVFDHNRFPVVTIAVGLGVLVALLTRTRPALLALLVFGFWLLAYFGRPTWGSLSDVISFDGRLWMHRFIGPMQIGGLLLVAVAAGWVYERIEAVHRLRWPAAAFAVILLLVSLPALGERWVYLDRNRVWMDEAQQSLNDDSDLQTVLAKLQTLPPGRVYAGLRDGWGDNEKHGPLRLPDILTFHEFETAAAPYQSLTLNSDLIWHFDERDAAHFDVLNARYFLAPSDLEVGHFLRPILQTARYTLYEAPTSGYFGLGITPAGFAGSQQDFFIAERAWFLSDLPAEGVYPAFALDGTPRLDGIDYAPMKGASNKLRALDAPDEPAASQITYEEQGPYAYEAIVDVDQPSTLFLKASYHPDWHAYVDGKEVEPFMAAPSYPAIILQPGHHDVRFVYKPNALRMPLFALGALTLIGIGLIEYRGAWHRKATRRG